MPTFTSRSATDDETDDEYALHRQIAELATLEPEIIPALQLLVHRALEAARTRVQNEHWEALGNLKPLAVSAELAHARRAKRRRPSA